MRCLLTVILCLPGVVARAGEPCATCGGDVDGDRRVDGRDIQPFFEAWIDGGVPACADIVDDGALDDADHAAFVTRLLTVDPACTPGPADVDLEVHWIHGSADCATNTDPPMQVHQVNDMTYIIRQNKCVNFEAPFIYLLFGAERVLMLDTGATSSAVLFPIGDTVRSVIDQWLIDHGRAEIDLVVAHTHAHGDHVQGDGQFFGQPNTTVVGTSLSAVQGYFGFTSWPAEIVTFELGGRTLEITGIPGHHSTHIAVYDPYNQWLLTGDTFYPGFLFISNFNQYRDSIARLVQFTMTHDVTLCMGTHVEMSAVPGVAYPYGTTHQPNEHVLQLTPDNLIELHEAVQAMGDNPVFEIHDDFIIFP